MAAAKSEDVMLGGGAVGAPPGSPDPSDEDSSRTKDLYQHAVQLAERAEQVLEKLKGIVGREDFHPTPFLGSRSKRNKQGVKGIPCLIKKVRTELNFTRSMVSGKIPLTLPRVQSTNLGIYEGIASVLEREKGVVAVQRVFHTAQRDVSVEVDVVAASGGHWIKVKSMNSRNIEDVLQGKGRYGDKSVVEIAEDLATVSRDNIVNFGVPEATIAFTNPIPAYVREAVMEKGVNVVVLGEEAEERGRVGCTAVPKPLSIQPPADLDPVTAMALAEELGEGMDDSFEFEDLPSAPNTAIDPAHVKVVNLDITAMFALTSDLTNGGHMFTFPKHPVLDLQAQEERRSPVRIILNDYLSDKELIVCHTARREFENIVGQVAGPEEKARAAELMKRATTVPDSPSPRALSLRDSNRIRDRQKTIFGTGDTNHAVTVTANIQFVHAAAEQGVSFAVFVHGARALTERKRKSDGVKVSDKVDESTGMSAEEYSSEDNVQTAGMATVP